MKTAERLPGFYAEVSLYQSHQLYYIAGSRATSSPGVVPALPFCYRGRANCFVDCMNHCDDPYICPNGIDACTNNCRVCCTGKGHYC